MPEQGPPLLALTMGEPAGIGPEIAVMAWLARADPTLPRFVAVADPASLAAAARAVGQPVPIVEVGEPEAAAASFPRALPVAPVTLARAATAGKPDALNAPAIVAAIDRAVGWAQAGRVAGVVTNPIQKATLYEAGFAFQGHTDYLGHLCGGEPAMMLASPALRVVPVTVHLSLRRAIESLSTELILATARIVAHSLRRDFGCAVPRLAVAGLNPHAGEAGGIGREEIEIIAPALERLRAEGLAVSGPHAADSMFHPAARAGYDAALCMYHDQALIPLKTVDFEGGVNLTLGLDIVRASPDHGTALDIAGSGRARPASLLAALRLAGEVARRRRAFDAAHA